MTLNNSGHEVDATAILDMDMISQYIVYYSEVLFQGLVCGTKLIHIDYM